MLHEGRLDQPALVVALFVPRVGKVEVHAGQRLRWDHRFQHFDRVVLHQPQVRQPHLADALEQGTHARRMHLDSDEVAAG
jgi:hypothetical protein